MFEKFYRKFPRTFAAFSLILSPLILGYCVIADAWPDIKVFYKDGFLVLRKGVAL